jgi:hypothetical protein
MSFLVKVYKITCSCCNKLYIGSTHNKKGIQGRLHGHRSDCNQGKGSKLYTHMREVGFDKFTITLLEEIEAETVKQQFQIENDKIIEFDSINNGFNTKRAYQSDEVKKQLKSIADKKYRDNTQNKEEANAYKREYRANLPVIHCECCNYSTTRPDTYARHLRGMRHINKMALQV